MSASRKVMFFNPVNVAPEVDQIFADMARACRLPGAEVHVASLPASAGRFNNIEFRTYEAIATAGIIRATRAAALEGFDAFVIGCFYDTALHDAREISDR
jgi:allantoin racemase